MDNFSSVLTQKGKRRCSFLLWCCGDEVFHALASLSCSFAQSVLWGSVFQRGDNQGVFWDGVGGLFGLTKGGGGSKQILGGWQGGNNVTPCDSKSITASNSLTSQHDECESEWRLRRVSEHLRVRLFMSLYGSSTKGSAHNKWINNHCSISILPFMKRWEWASRFTVEFDSVLRRTSQFGPGWFSHFSNLIPPDLNCSRWIYPKRALWVFYIRGKTTS